MAENSGASIVRRFFKMLKADRKDIRYIYIYAIFIGFTNLTLPLGVQAILNYVQAGAISFSWWVLILGVTLGALVTGLLTMMQMTVSETLQRRIFTRVSFDFAERIPRLNSEANRQRYIPELVNRFFDTLTVQKGLPKILIDISMAIIQIVFGLILLSFYHPLFIAFGFFLLIFLFIILRYTSPVGLKTSIAESKHKYDVAYWLEELGRAMSTFKLAGHSDLPLKNTDKLVSKYLDAKQSHFKILLIQYASIISFKTLITFVLLSLGGWLVISNQINIGQFIAAELVVLLVIASSEKLVKTMDVIYDVLTAIDKLGGVSDLPLDRNDGIDFDMINTGNGISVEIDNLSYSFSQISKPVIDNISLRIAPGERICIAGYNGSGKTTLVQILSCFLTQFTGSIIYNGIPQQNLSPQSLHRIIGDYSSQEDIFKGTIRENIDLGNTGISFAEVVEMAKKIGLLGFIQNLPGGFDTILLPNGKNLPRHIIVKIILLRNLVCRPQLLAIEEIMANLEYEDRLRIADVLTNNNAPWTLIAVTNDPILASKCDRVLVMKEGKIIEEGNFKDIQQSRHFYHIFKTTQ